MLSKMLHNRQDTYGIMTVTKNEEQNIFLDLWNAIPENDDWAETNEST